MIQLFFIVFVIHHKVRLHHVEVYREELELDRLYLRLLGGDRLRDFDRDRRRGDGERDLLPALNEPRNLAGGDLLHAGGGGRRRGGGGLGRRTGLVSRGLMGSTICAVISCPSICPPSMCFKADSASSASS